MALVSLRQLLVRGGKRLRHARLQHTIWNRCCDHVRADKTDVVIMQASRGARKYANDTVLRHLIEASWRCILTSRSVCTKTTTTRPHACPPSLMASRR